MRRRIQGDASRNAAPCVLGTVHMPARMHARACMRTHARTQTHVCSNVYTQVLIEDQRTQILYRFDHECGIHGSELDEGSVVELDVTEQYRVAAYSIETTTGVPPVLSNPIRFLRAAAMPSRPGLPTRHPHAKQVHRSWRARRRQSMLSCSVPMTSSRQAGCRRWDGWRWGLVTVM